MPRGGARPGAGRKPKGEKAAVKAAESIAARVHEPSPATAGIAPAPASDPIAFLLGVMNDLGQDPALRVKAAVAAAPYLHTKKGEGGKKEGRQEAAERAAGTSKFAPGAPPPKLTVVK